MSKNPFTNQKEAVPPDLNKAPLTKDSRSSKRFKKYEDGSTLVDVFQLDPIIEGKRHVLHDIVTNKPANKTIIYGDGPMMFTEHLIKNLLMDEYGRSNLTYNGFNILELSEYTNLNHVFRWINKNVGHYKYFNLFMKDPLDVNSNVIQNIVRENDINLIIHNLNWDIFQGEHIEKLTPGYISALKGATEHLNIPIVGVLESYKMSDELYEFADVLVKIDHRIEEDQRLHVLSEKPEEPLFDPCFLYEDGSFVYEKDSLNSEIMNTLGKRVIHPEE